MKKAYETPVVEKIEFCYKDQIVASFQGVVCDYYKGAPSTVIGCDWKELELG